MLSITLLQADGWAVAPSMSETVPVPTIGPFSVEFILHAAFIWAALIVICLIVFGYRRLRSKEPGNAFPDVYMRDLQEMRRRAKKSTGS